MILMGKSDITLNRSIPRESGDDPFKKIFRSHFGLYSPRERG